MTPKDRTRFVTLLTGVHSFYRVDMTDFAVGVWTRALGTYAIEAIERAFDQHAKDPKAGSFMPKPADLIRMLDGTQEDRAAIAWAKVLGAIGSHGSYATVVFDDGAIHAAIADLGGWPQVCAVTLDELPFMSRRFCTAYSAHAAAGSAYPPRLLGVHDLNNAPAGYGSQAPVLIGNEAAALAVMAAGIQPVRKIAGSFTPIVHALPGMTQ